MQGWTRDWAVATRVSAVAVGASAVALLALLVGLYVVVTGQLQATVDAGLAARSADLQRSVDTEGAQVVAAETYAELYDDAVVQVSPALRGAGPLVPDLGRVRTSGSLLLTRELAVRGGREEIELRVLARTLPGGRVLTVGASLQPQQEVAERLLVGLAVTGPLLLLLVALAVRGAVRSALRPVGTLTREADRISAAEDTRRLLPAVPGTDEIALLAATLNAMLSRLSVAFERERAFVDEASHELRTPVAVLRGEIELALSDLDDRTGVETSLKAALTEAERLSRLAEDLLVLARGRTGGLVLRVDTLDVDALLHDTADRLGRGIEIRVEVADDAQRWTGDRDRLDQVLTNLVVNAVAAGSGVVLLTAELDHDVPGTGRCLLLSVQDDGPGFAPDFAPLAFERFSRADPARTRSGGAGLGLALVAAIVHAAGGTVAAGDDSALGGAAVRVRLPDPSVTG